MRPIMNTPYETTIVMISGTFTLQITGMFKICPTIVAVYNDVAKTCVPKRTNGKEKVSKMK